jgi:hypothetical protein
MVLLLSLLSYSSFLYCGLLRLSLLR